MKFYRGFLFIESLVPVFCMSLFTLRANVLLCQSRTHEVVFLHRALLLLLCAYAAFLGLVFITHLFLDFPLPSFLSYTTILDAFIFHLRLVYLTAPRNYPSESQ